MSSCVSVWVWVWVYVYVCVPGTLIWMPCGNKSRVKLSHVTHVNVAQMWMSHGTHTCEWDMSHVNESSTCNHRARPPRSMVPRIVNESRPIQRVPYERVMSHILTEHDRRGPWFYEVAPVDRQKLRKVNLDTNGYSYVAYVLSMRQCLCIGLYIGLVVRSGAKSCAKSTSTPMGIRKLHILCWFNNVYFLVSV